MNIPDKYRDRYDALAEEHPWMREMRDETETIGDLIEKRKEEIEERNFLIAKARNSFKSLAESNYDYTKFRKACRRATEIMDAEMARMGIASDGRALEASDEPTNGDGGGTNGIADGSPLVDRDPVEIMRKVANGDEVTGNAMRKEVGGTDWSDALLILADMVERDYVRREHYYERVKELGAECDELQRKLEIADRHEFESDQRCDECKERTDELLVELTAERDGLRVKLADLNAEYYDVACAKSAEIRRLEGERDEALEIRDKAIGDAATFKAERDEWKAKAEAKSAKRAAAVERLKELDEDADSEDIVKAMIPEGVTVNRTNWTVELDALIDLLTDNPMDAQRDGNGTCHNANGTASNDYGLFADMSEKSADCVRNDEKTSENDVRAGSVDDLARTLGETMAERELYRDLCGQMLDAMDEIRAKVDASFPRGAREVM